MPPTTNSENAEFKLIYEHEKLFYNLIVLNRRNEEF